MAPTSSILEKDPIDSGEVLTGAEYDRVWAIELERRVRAIQAGESQLFDWADVVRELRSKRRAR